jgi:F-type H+-transporting ATPase subunit b
MQLDWMTFVLEIVNFLILVWILRHFLYRPILATIERRRAAIEKTMNDAAAGKAQAEDLERHYNERLAAWEKEKEGLRSEALAEIDEDRRRRLAAVQEEVDREAERRRAIERNRAGQAQRKMEREVSARAARMAGRLATRLASPAVEEELARMLLEDLDQLPVTRRKAIADACRQAGNRFTVASAFALPDPVRARVTDGIRRLVGVEADGEFIEDPDLVAGLRVSLGSSVLHANIGDELEFFRERAVHAS